MVFFSKNAAMKGFCAFFCLFCFFSLTNVHGAQKKDPVPTKSIKEYEAEAQKGNGEALFMLGNIYDKGQGVPANYPLAKEYYEQAARRNHASAQNKLGMIYLDAAQAEKDKKNTKKAEEYLATALEYLERAAKNSHMTANLMLGLLYSNGEKLKKNSEKAAYYYEKAAKKGSAAAQYALASLYHEGKDLVRDSKKALAWAQKAAQQGLAEAQFLLGEMLAYNPSLNTEKDNALAWYEKALAQGYVPALPALVDAIESRVVRFEEAEKNYAYILALHKLDESNKTYKTLKEKWQASLSKKEIQKAEKLLKGIQKNLNKWKNS